ncbi:MAG: type II toxin-antitoxin system VapC family toxin [Candidatus Bathyarchaeia archaeon]
MAHARRYQKYLAVDSNVLVAYLDREHPQHRKVTSLASHSVALNPTVVHETYHTLVFKIKWAPLDASDVLTDVLNDTKILFLNQTKDTTKIGLRLGERYALGGRDALLLASFLNPSVAEFETFDKELIQLRKVEHGRRELVIRSA